MKTLGCAVVAGLAMSSTAVGQCEYSKQSKERMETNIVMASETAPTKDIVDTAVSAGSFNTLAKALQAAGLVDALKGKGPFTVFAPTDEAFAKLPKGTLESLLRPESKEKLQAILMYHVVPGKAVAKDVVTKDAWATLNGQRIDIEADGRKVRIDGATVAATDVMATNGVIHVIDRVILPESKNIVGVADSAGSFSTLLAAAKAAGLAEVLSGEGPFTVFAPTDEAFAKLPEGTVESLLRPENRDKLAAILKYHVVPGRVFSNQAIDAGRATTVQGDEVRIGSRYGKVMVNKAKVVNADIDASNGVIHVIDTVLLPE